jgi:glyceraldehyde 3-phosphate dehydrogenase
VIESMAGRLDGAALPVPVAGGARTHHVALGGRAGSVDDVNEAFRVAATTGRLASVLDYSEDPLVSSDIVGSAASCTFDAPLTMAAGHLVKVFGWYDNEWGYANRLAELSALVGR